MSENAKPADRYACSIHTEAVRPMGAMGRIRHVAKVIRMVDRKLGTDVSADQFGETWGENASEAAHKMTEKIEAWIASTSGECVEDGC